MNVNILPDFHDYIMMIISKMPTWWFIAEEILGCLRKITCASMCITWHVIIQTYLHQYHIIFSVGSGRKRLISPGKKEYKIRLMDSNNCKWNEIYIFFGKVFPFRDGKYKTCNLPTHTSNTITCYHSLRKFCIVYLKLILCLDKKIDYSAQIGKICSNDLHM